MSALNFAVSTAVGAAVGILTGFGVGGGTILMIYLTSFGNIAPQAAKGINLLYFFPCSGTSLVFHFKGGFVEKRLLLPAIVPGVVCAGAAAWLSTFLDPGLFTKIFGAFLIIVGLRELFTKG